MMAGFARGVGAGAFVTVGAATGGGVVAAGLAGAGGGGGAELEPVLMTQPLRIKIAVKNPEAKDALFINLSGM
jgi:hypothetical protein